MFTAKQKAFIKTQMDELFEEFHKTCLLTYPPTTETCVNCVFDPIGKKSSNHYKDGGPVPFQQSICPMCGGEGQRATENTEEIDMVIYIHARQQIQVNANIKTFNYDFNAKIKIADFPKVRKAEYITIQTPISGYTKFKCKLAGEPIDNHNITQNEYMIVRLERVG